MTLTQKQAITAIRRMGATVKVSDREYRVNVPKGTEGTAYYTDDPEDAVGTARIMMARYHQLSKKRTFLGMFQD